MKDTSVKDYDLAVPPAVYARMKQEHLDVVFRALNARNSLGNQCDEWISIEEYYDPSNSLLQY